MPETLENGLSIHGAPTGDAGIALDENFTLIDGWRTEYVALAADLGDISGIGAALALKAPIESPALTGTPTAPTPLTSDVSTKVATTAYVNARVAALINAAPSAYDTLGEIATKLSDNDDALSVIVLTVGEKLAKDQNLSDLTDASIARDNLGVYSVDAVDSLVDAKANTGHTHAMADVTGLLTTLNSFTADLNAHGSNTSPHGATSANTASRIVMRDGSGGFSAGAIALSGTLSKTNTSTTVTLDVNTYPTFPATDFAYPAGGKFRVGEVGVAGTNDVFFQAIPATTAGYGYLEAFAGAGMIVGTGNATSIRFKPNRSDVAQIAPPPTGSSGAPTVFYVGPGVNQSGSAGYNIFHVEASHSAVGSGNKNLVLGTVNFATRFRIDHTGSAFFEGTISPGTYTVATLPTAGTSRRFAYASNGRKPGEGVGAGTGVPVYDDGAAWRSFVDGATVTA